MIYDDTECEIDVNILPDHLGTLCWDYRFKEIERFGPLNFFENLTPMDFKHPDAVLLPEDHFDSDESEDFE